MLMENSSGNWAETTKELTTAAGGFIAAPLRELVGMATDHLKVVRAERQERLAERFHKFLKERGLEKPTKDINPAFLVPLIEHASLEHDNDLQDIWARMLAAAADAESKVEIRTAFISMLKDVSPFDVQILAKIEATTPIHGRYVPTVKLPESIDQSSDTSNENEMREDVQISLANLVRLGCLDPLPAIDGPSNAKVSISELGRAFVKACTGHPSA